MIREIEMRNVKGQTAVQELTGKDIIIGRNGAGKTTRMQSIGLAMLGYVPGKGKTLADTFKLASDEEMSVRLSTDGFELMRSFAKSRKLAKDGSEEVKISQQLAVSPSMGETTNTKKEQRIRQELGDFPVMLDFGAFIAMTDNQQRDFIYNLSGNGFTWDRDMVEAELLATLLRPELCDTNPELFECMNACVTETMKQYREGMDIQDGILAMAEHAKEQLKYWKKEKTNADGAARKLTELKNRGAETDRDITINIEKRNELQEKREEIIKELAAIAANNQVLRLKAEELQKLRAEIAAMEEKQDSAAAIEALNAEIAELTAAITEHEGIEHQYAEREQSLRNEMASLQSAWNTAGELQLANKEKLATINAELKANGDLLQRIQDSRGCCAFSPNIPCGQDFSEFINATHDTMDAAYDQKDEVEQIIRTTKEHLDDLKVKIRDTQSEQARLVNDRKENNRAAVEKARILQQKTGELNALQTLEPELAAKRQQEAVIAAYLEENQEVDLTAMEEQKTRLSGQIEALTATIDNQKKIKNDLINIQANMIDSKTAAFNVLAWTQLGNAIGQKGIKGSIMKEMLNPLLEDVNAKLHEIGINEEFFFATNSDTGKEIFEFGWSGRPFAALSTGEQLLLMTAMMTTMIERANPPVKVLAIDNINDLDQHNLGIIMRGLGTIGKNMDNIILAGVVEPTEEASEGWKVWRL